MGKLAAKSGITVNLIAVVGAECNIQELSKMCEASGGLVENVDPSQLKESMTKALSQKIIASCVELKINLNPYFKFRNESDKDLSNDKSTLIRLIGNQTN